MIHHFTRLVKPKSSEVYDTYWKFAAERLNIFYKRAQGDDPPWTDDIILRVFKFTNPYRAADRVSQYLIREVIYKDSVDPPDIFFRVVLFKLFNKIETWQSLERLVGPIRWCNYDFDRFSTALEQIRASRGAIYSGAYIMASGKSNFGDNRKHRNHLRLLESMMRDRVPAKLQNAKSMEEVYELLKSYPVIGSFLAYQYTIDINYSELTSFSEMEFVKAGPGAIDGIRKCFEDPGDFSEEDIIRWVCDRQEQEFDRLGLQFDGLWGRPLQLIDCQNLFCETDKYSRVAHPEVHGKSKRTRIKQRFEPSSLSPMKYVFPPQWGICTHSNPLSKSNG